MAFLAGSCFTTTGVTETPLSIPNGGNPAQPRTTPSGTQPRPAEGGVSNGGSIVDEIRSSAERGTPSSLQNGLYLIRDRGLSSNDFGRTMNAVISTLMQKVYPNPALRLSISLAELPQSSQYTKILKEVALGRYLEPAAASQDYLEYVLPFLGILDSSDARLLLAALPHLSRAQDLNPYSVLAPYFTGVIYERLKRFPEALDAYQRAYTVSGECYPAALGLVRLMNSSGQNQEAMWILQDLINQFPDNMTIKRELARGYYQNKDWSRAESAIQEALQRNTRDGEFLLMLAHTQIEQKQFLRAATTLDQYGAIDTTNQFYLFLRARNQAEGYRNVDAALTYLRSILNRPNIDPEIAAYTAGLLLESSRPGDQQDGRALLQRLLQGPSPSLQLIETAFKDAARREAWAEAKSYLPRLLSEGPAGENLLRAYRVERGLGNREAALRYAKELYDREPSNEDGALAYVTGLIDLGRTGEAAGIIDRRLGSANSGPAKAQYYYLRSRLQRDEDAVLQDLRSALFSDPRNSDALLGMLDYYHRRGDERRAVYYYKQAQSFDPTNPRLRQYDRFYAD